MTVNEFIYFRTPDIPDAVYETAAVDPQGPVEAQVRAPLRESRLLQHPTQQQPDPDGAEPHQRHSTVRNHQEGEQKTKRDHR